MKKLPSTHQSLVVAVPSNIDWSAEGHSSMKTNKFLVAAVLAIAIGLPIAGFVWDVSVPQPMTSTGVRVTFLHGFRRRRGITVRLDFRVIKAQVVLRIAKWFVPDVGSWQILLQTKIPVDLAASPTAKSSHS
jgi:hypothetical protein